jgi:hypothetical protein
MNTKQYKAFIAKKSQLGEMSGFDPLFMPDFLFPFQTHLVEWAIRKGRGAIFADCGLGKTPMQLVWAENVVRKTNKPVLILSPLAVSQQTVAEGEKFGIDVKRSMDGKHNGGITITNYERLHYFKPSDFAGVVCDESSAIKHAKACRRTEITAFMRKRPYRLLCTATAAPNDFIELGTSSEALGYLGYQDMLTQFFKQETQVDGLGWGRMKYRFRGHAEDPFWRWVCSWAMSCRKPSDLGYDDNGFILPPLLEREHKVEAGALRDGQLFTMPAVSLNEQRDERRQTIDARCEAVADHISKIDGPTVSWCHLNAEGDLLEKVIPNAHQVKGAMVMEEKEEKLIAFQNGQIDRLVIKPKIGCFGLNWQHCSNITTFVSHSYEQYYQCIRRCLRFGQKNPVNVDIFCTQGEERVLNNLKRKSNQINKMFASLVSHMDNTADVARDYNFDTKEECPSWL